MSIDIKKPVNLALSDPKWLEKLFIGGLFYFVFQVMNSIISLFNYFIRNNIYISTVPDATLFSSIIFNFAILILFIFLTAIPFGYVLQSVHNQVNETGEFLPDWGDKMYFYFINGIKFLFIKFIYVVILFFLIMIVSLVGFAIYSTFITNIAVAYSSIILFTTIGILITLSYCLILPLIFISFAENYRITDAFNIKKYIRIIYNNIYDYILCDIAVFGLIILQIFLSILLVCTCIGILLIPFLYLPVFLIIINLFTQTYFNYKKASGKELT